MKARRLLPFGVALVLMTVAGPLWAQEKQGSAAPSSLSAATNEAGRTQGFDQPVLKRRYPRYQLRAGDVLELVFSLTPEFNQTVTVQPDGYITLRGVNDVYLQGQTLPEAAETLRTAYARILRNPLLAVIPKDLDLPHFTVAGWVRHPGKYQLRADTTVTEAVAVAGGFTEQSKHSQVYVYRQVGGTWTQVAELNLKKMLSNGELGEDVHLQPGDLIYVPQNTLSKIKDVFVPRLSVGPRLP